jgi:hypothetical protein
MRCYRRMLTRKKGSSTSLLRVCERAAGGGYLEGMPWNAKQWRRSTQRFNAFMVPLVVPGQKFVDRQPLG